MKVFDARLRAMDTVERNKALCKAVIECKRKRGMVNERAVQMVAHELGVREGTVRDAYYRYRKSVVGRLTP